MDKELTTIQPDVGALMEQVIIKGDLADLKPNERTAYYMKVCESAGLNPLTKPFDYIKLNNKLTLYALRGCTDQLRGLHGVSVEELTESERDGVFCVTAKVKNAAGRTDIAKGAVNIKGLSGDNLANAMMKAETKAKRRATLSLCGLGWLDETEIETIPNAQRVSVDDGTQNSRKDAQKQNTPPVPSSSKPDEHGSASTQSGNRAAQARAWAEEAERFVRAIKDAASLEAWNSKNAKAIAAAKSLAPQAHKNLITAIDKRRADLNPVSA